MIWKYFSTILRSAQVKNVQNSRFFMTNSQICRSRLPIVCKYIPENNLILSNFWRAIKIWPSYIHKSLIWWLDWRKYSQKWPKNRLFALETCKWVDFSSISKRLMSYFSLIFHGESISGLIWHDCFSFSVPKVWLICTKMKKSIFSLKLHH